MLNTISESTNVVKNKFKMNNKTLKKQETVSELKHNKKPVEITDNIKF